MVAASFKGTEKDFTDYLAVMQLVGLRKGATVLDFGASWGYGSWQLSNAGYDVYSFEISVPRQQYAKQRLGCKIIENLDQAVPIDCLFSSHVVEHLSNPGELWQRAYDLLKPGGVFFCACPNGNPAREASRHYDQMWGKVHPMAITPEFMRFMGAKFGFVTSIYSSPYSEFEFPARSNGGLLGDELLTIAVKHGSGGEHFGE